MRKMNSHKYLLVWLVFPLPIGLFRLTQGNGTCTFQPKWLLIGQGTLSL